MAGVMVFVDGSYFETQMRGLGSGLRWDIEKVGPSLTEATGLHAATFEWLHYYGSYPPPEACRTPADHRAREERIQFLERLMYARGVSVAFFERRLQSERCSACSSEIVLAREKGVDVSLTSDMLRLGWAEAYDAAVLVAGDADLLPAVRALKERGIKVLVASLTDRPGLARQLRSECWAVIPLQAVAPALRRE